MGFSADSSGGNYRGGGVEGLGYCVVEGGGQGEWWCGEVVRPESIPKVGLGARETAYSAIMHIHCH